MVKRNIRRERYRPATLQPGWKHCRSCGKRQMIRHPKYWTLMFSRCLCGNPLFEGNVAI